MGEWGRPKGHETATNGRRISPEHVARLRAIVRELGGIRPTRDRLGVGEGVIEDAITYGGFRADTIARLEAKIDAYREERGAA